MVDKITYWTIKTSRNAYIQRVSIINDRDKKIFPYVIAYETKNKSEALKFDSDITAQALADLLNDTKEESFFPELEKPVI